LPVSVSGHIGLLSSRRGPSPGGTLAHSSVGMRPRSGGSGVASRPCVVGNERAGYLRARTLYRTVSSRRQISVRMRPLITTQIRQMLYKNIRQTQLSALLFLHTVYSYTTVSQTTHTFNGPFSGSTQVSRHQKGKTSLDFNEARDSEWQWHQLGHMQVCTSLQTDNHASTPPLSFLQAGCPSCHPTNSVKALKAVSQTNAFKNAQWYITSFPEEMCL